jgi:hypothetical protein
MHAAGYFPKVDTNDWLGLAYVAIVLAWVACTICQGSGKD